MQKSAVTFKNSLMSVTGIGSDNIKAGGQYTVHWNGTAHECTAYMQGQSTMLGNGALNGGEDDTGEPFCIEVLTGNASMITKNTSDAEAVIICVEGRDSIEWHTLDPKYIKDMYYEEEVEGDNVLFKTTLSLAEIYNEEDSEGFRQDKIDLVEGQTYTILCNGEEYTGVAKALMLDGMLFGIAVGNNAYISSFNNSEADDSDVENDIPIVVVALSEQIQAETSCTTMIISLYASLGIEVSANVPIEISQEGTITKTHKIDPKYLPDKIADWEATKTEWLLTAEQTLKGGDKINGLTKEMLVSIYQQDSTLIVYCDGIRYESKIVFVEGMYAVGNLYILNPENPHTGEPFILLVDSRINYIMFVDEAEHTMSFAKYIHNRLPRKYAPEMMYSITDLSGKEIEKATELLLQGYQVRYNTYENVIYAHADSGIYPTAVYVGTEGVLQVSELFRTHGIESGKVVTPFMDSDVQKIKEGQWLRCKGSTGYMDNIILESVDPWVIESASGKKFKISIDDSGTLGTAEVS